MNYEVGFAALGGFVIGFVIAVILLGLSFDGYVSKDKVILANPDTMHKIEQAEKQAKSK